MSMDAELIVKPLPPLAMLERDWSTLEDRAGQTVFTSWAWIGTWLALLPKEIEPLLLRFMRGTRTVGLGILVRHESRRHGLLKVRALHLNATGRPALDGLTIEHNGILAEPQDVPMLAARLVDWFRAEQEDAEELHIPGSAPLGLSIAGRLDEARPQAGYTVDLHRARSAGFPQLLSRNTRQQLRRASRAAAASGPLSLDEAGSVAEALSFFAGLKALHVAAWQARGRRHSFDSPFFEVFHRELISRAGGTGNVQLLRIRAGERMLGYLYQLRDGNRVLAYQSGLCYADPALRPGLVAYALAIEDSAARGAALYDFLAGRTQLKDSLSTEEYRLCWHIFRRPTIALRIERALRDAKRTVKGINRAA